MVGRGSCHGVGCRWGIPDVVEHGWGVDIDVAGDTDGIFRNGGFGGIEIELCTAGVELRVWRGLVSLMEGEKFGPSEVISTC